MPESRLSSRARRRTQAARASGRPRLPQHPFRPGRSAQGVLALGLVLVLGGYAVAESTTRRNTAAAERAALAVHVQAQAKAHAVVVGERSRAVASATDTVADATAVRTVAAPAVSEADLTVLTDAVDHLSGLIADVPAEASASGTGSPAPSEATESVEPTEQPEIAVRTEGVERASRGVSREALPEPSPSPSAEPEAATEPAPAQPESPTEPALPTDGAPSLATSGTGAGDAFRALGGATGDEDVADVPPADDVAAGIVAASARVATLTARLKTTAERSIAAAAEAAAAAAEVKRAAEAAAKAAEAAARVEAQRISLDAYANGRVPADALCSIAFAPGHQLRCDAADSLAALNESYQATFGSDLAISDSYRSYGAQVACARTKGRLCATPGTSNHGLGVALDLGDGVQKFGTAQHRWMVAHAGASGWVLPEWASITGSKPEPWHWEFTN